MKNYYLIGLSFDDVPGLESVKEKIRSEAEAGARKGVEAEIPRIRSEAASGARAAVKPLVAIPIGLSIASILIAVLKK